MPRTLFSAALCLGFLLSPTCPGQSSRLGYADKAAIVRIDGLSKVMANDPRPLDKAIVAVREEYGLLVNYEDPVYQSRDLVDDTDPSWKKKHPGERSVTVPRGGTFSVTYSESALASPSGYENLLAKITSDYNHQNPTGEQFRLVSQGTRRFAVVPVSKTPLDALVELPPGKYRLADAVFALASAVFQTSGTRVIVGLMPIGLAQQSFYEEDGKPAVARAKLASIFDFSNLELVSQMLYDADSNQYFLNYSVARQVWTNANGDRLLEPLRNH